MIKKFELTTPTGIYYYNPDTKKLTMELSNDITGVFEIPEHWARTRLFQFIDDIDSKVN